MEADGRTRTEGNLHGGKPEYRHLCGKCGCGIWVGDRYPRATYQEVVADLPIKEKKRAAPAEA